jgi:hypothetical protein
MTVSQKNTNATTRRKNNSKRADNVHAQRPPHHLSADFVLRMQDVVLCQSVATIKQKLTNCIECSDVEGSTYQQENLHQSKGQVGGRSEVVENVQLAFSKK